MLTRILLADDHQILLDGLRQLLDGEADLEVVGAVRKGRDLLEAVERVEPDVVVTDVILPDLDGIDVTRQLLARRRETKVIALSVYADKKYVLAALEAGVAGYVVKGDAAADLLKAIRAARSNDTYLSPSIAGFLVETYVDGETVPWDGRDILGAREREVLRHLADGRTSREVAGKLGISASTAATHRRNIMRKLGLHTIAQLTKYAIREGLTTADPRPVE